MKNRPLCLVALALILWITGRYLTGGLKKIHLPEELLQQSVTVQGEIYRQETKKNTLIYLKNISIISKEKKSSYLSNILIYTKENTDYHIGDLVEVTGEGKEIEKSTNPGQFDSASWYASKNIGMMIQNGKIKRVKKQTNRLLQALADIREQLEIITYRIGGEKDASLLSAMLLGDKREVPTQVKNLYQMSGISHVLAISGLHISMLGIALYRLFRLCGMSFCGAGTGSGVLMLAYCIMTGMGTSTLRAFIMFAVYLLAQILGRTYDLRSALALAVILMLFEQPLLLMQGGFQLSVLAVAGVSVVYPVLAEMFKGKTKLTEALLVSVSVQLMVFPCTLYHYYAFSWMGVFLNLLILPCMSLLLLTGMSGVLAGFFSQTMGILCFAPCHYLLRLYEISCNLSLRMPGSYQIWGKPAIGSIVLYYLVLLLVIVLWKKKENTEKRQRGVCILLGMLAVLVAAAGLRVHERAELEMTFLDVGQGDGIFWQLEDGTSFLCDGGSSSVTDVGTYRILPFLKEKGVAVLNYVFLTHMDEDHVNGIEELLQQKPVEIGIRHLILPDISEKSERFRSLERLADEQGIAVSYFHAGVTMEKDKLQITCLAPFYGMNRESENENSMVLQVRYGEFQALLTGDMEGQEEEWLLNQKKLTPVSVLKVAHHGSKGATSEAFLAQVRPEVSIISCGKENRYGHPHWQLLRRLEQMDTCVCKTTEEGAITVRTDGREFSVRGFCP